MVRHVKQREFNKESDMKATETTKTRVQTGTTSATTTTLTAAEKIDSAITASTFAGTAIIDLWSLAALVGEMITAGGLLGLVKGYFQALTGL
jgi:hypothetical protein